MGTSRRIENNTGSANVFLKSAATVDQASTKIAKAASSFDVKKLSSSVQAILDAIKSIIEDSNAYQMNLDSISIDVVLGRIASLLDEKFSNCSLDDLSTLLESIKEKLDNSSSSTTSEKSTEKEDSTEKIVKAVAESIQANSEIQEIKKLLEKQSSKQTFQDKQVDSLKDEKNGDYKDSTMSKNFLMLQTAIEKQIQQLNVESFGITDKIMTVINTIGAISSAITGNVFGAITKGISAISGAVGWVSSKVKDGFSSIGKNLSKFGKGIGSTLKNSFSGIGKLFHMPRFLSPSDKRKHRAEEIRQKSRDKIMNFIAKIVDKLFVYIEPALDKLQIYMLAALPLIIKISLIIAAIVAGAVLLFIFVKKIIDWYKSGQLMKKIGEILSSIWDKLLEFGQWIWEQLPGWLSKLWEWSKDLGKFLWDTLVKIWKWEWDCICKAWDWIVDFGAWLWDMLVAGVKYVFCGMWVDLGKWLWSKLVAFGKWLYNNYIYKYIVGPFVEKIWNPVKNWWNNSVWPVIEPFVTSLTNLKDSILSIFSAWDSNKSFMENISTIGSLIKQAVLDWWNESPFKAFYEKYLDPIIQSVKDLIAKIKEIWNNFKWDSNKSFVDNLMTFWNSIKQAIKDWWQSSAIKKYWDKFVDWLTNIFKKIKDWWNGTTLGKAINSFFDKLRELKEKLGNMIWDFPAIPYFRPFGFLVGKPTMLSDAEKEDYEKFGKKLEELEDEDDDAKDDEEDALEEIADLQHKIATGDYTGPGGNAWVGRSKAEMEADLAKEMQKLEAARAKQQSIKENKARIEAERAVSQGNQIVDNINNQQQKDVEELDNTSKEISKEVEQKEQKKEVQDKELAQTVKKINDDMQVFMPNVYKKLDDPSVIAAPVPYSTSNPAPMM